MKGQVLDFNLQSGEGLISSEDGERYSFVSSEWKSSEQLPAKNVKVDFTQKDAEATAIYAEQEVHSANESANTGTAKLIYFGYLAGLIIPFVSLIGLIMAYINKGNGPHWLDENYRFQIRTFWIGVLYFFTSALLTIIVIGWFTFIVTLIWYIIRCVKGIKALNNNKAPENIDGWLF